MIIEYNQTALCVKYNIPRFQTGLCYRVIPLTKCSINGPHSYRIMARTATYGSSGQHLDITLKTCIAVETYERSAERNSF